MKYFYSLLLLTALAFSPLKSKELIDDPYVHYAGINFGSTTIFDHYTSGHIGLNYEFKKYTGRHGIGFFMDYIFGPRTEILFGFPLSFHKAFGTDGLVISVAPGMGFTSSLNYQISESSTTPTDEKFLNNETRLNFLLRGSASWEFPIKNDKEEFMMITPYINIDVIANSETYLSIGAKFNFYIY